jgi:hypothetical protein
MTNPTRKLWNRGTDESEQLPEQEAPVAPTRAVSEQAATPDVPDEGSADADASADLADVGAEVGTVLKSAQEAAARIRQKAHEEVAKIREEAKAAADSELTEARRVRSQAEKSAQELRANAEREADQLLKTTRTRMAHIDAEVEEKVREAESAALRRRDALQAESKLYEERLEKMLGVFQGMSSQLEELLGKRTEETAEDEEATDGTALQRALQPYSARRS